MTSEPAKRRGRWALTVLAIPGLLALLIAVTAWSYRPKWRTYTFPADPKTGYAIAIDYPGNRVFEEVSDRKPHLTWRGITCRNPDPLVPANWWRTSILSQWLLGKAVTHLSYAMFYDGTLSAGKAAGRPHPLGIEQDLRVPQTLPLQHNESLHLISNQAVITVQDSRIKNARCIFMNYAAPEASDNDLQFRELVKHIRVVRVIVH